MLASRSPAELAESLTDPSLGVARAAARRLAEIGGPPAAEPLRARLLVSDLALVADIGAALRTIRDPHAAEDAIAALTEEPYSRRLAAARALGALGDARAVGPLRGALKDPVSGVRVAALAALAQLGPAEAAAPDCARLLSDAHAHVRIAAVEAVARTAEPPGTLLAPAAGDEDRLVRLAVAHHVAALPEHAASALLADGDLRVREAAALSAGTRQGDALAVLLGEDPSGAVRRAAAHTLGSLGDVQAVDALIPALEDPDAIVRAAALRALEELLSRAGLVARLRAELASERAARRRATVYTLANLRAHLTEEDALRLADDPDPDVRLAVVHSAGSLLADPEPPLRNLAADRDPVVRDSAQNQLLRLRRGSYDE